MTVACFYSFATNKRSDYDITTDIFNTKNCLKMIICKLSMIDDLIYSAS